MAYGVRNENERFFHQKIPFFQSSWNFEEMYPIVFGPALRSCFSLWMIFNLPSPSLKKILFSMKKTRFLVRDGLWVQKWEWTFFLSKNRFFSKTMRVGSKSFRGWNKTPKPFRIRWETVAESFSNFEKIDFLWKKNTHSHFWPHTPFLTKCAFFHQKIDFFQRRWG